MDFILTLIALVVIIGVLVFVHELGHFVAAKLSGLQVNEFAFGWGRALVQRKFGETIYKINLWPIGGYVAIEGEAGEESESPKSFVNKPAIIKLFVLTAGVMMNFFLAVVLSAIFLASVNYQFSLGKIIDYDFVGTESIKEIPSALFISLVQEDSVAEENLELGDIIISANEQEFTNTEDFLEFLDANQGQEVTFELVGVPGFEQRQASFVLPTRENPEDAILGAGISLDPNSYYVIEYPHNVLAGVSHSVNLFGFQLSALVDLVNQSVAQSDISPVAEQVGGVVAVSGLVGQLISIREFGALLNLTAVVSLSLVFVNMLPIPALDGGQCLIVIYEAVRRKKLSEKVVVNLNRFGFILIIVLSIVITLKDIIQLDVLGSLLSSIRTVLGQ